MTSNPEPAGVEPVAWMYDYRVAFRDNDQDWASGYIMVKGEPPRDNPDYRNIVPLYAHPPAAREDSEAVEDYADWTCQCGEENTGGGKICGFCDCERIFGDVAHLSALRPAPETSVQKLHESTGAPDYANCAVGEELVKSFARAMRESIAGENRLGWHEPTVQQSEHMARAALAAMPTSDAIRAETTAQIVAWLRAQVSHPMGRGPTQNAIAVAADAIECGDHLTGGGE